MERGEEQEMRTRSTQEDSIVRGEGTSIYKTMSKKQLLEAARKQREKVHYLLSSNSFENYKNTV